MKDVKRRFKELEIQVGSHVAQESVNRLQWEHEHPVLAFLQRIFFIIK